MAPTLMEVLLSKRQITYECGYLDDNCGNSGWNNWGRWVALVVIIVAFIILALAFSCINNRRRRRRGAPPMYGTSWIPYTPKYNYNNGQYDTNYYGHQPYNGGAPAPPYSPPIGHQATGNTFNSNEGYYGNHGYRQQTGIELQQPTSSYHPQREVDPVYDAPMGPPPKKSDYVVR